MSQPPSAALVKRGQFAMSPDVPLTRVRGARPGQQEPGAPSINVNEVLLALFKHKKLIILGAIVGLLGAIGVFFFYPPKYESNAKLLVRYLVERSTVDGVDTARNASGYSATTDTIIGSEGEILSSWDLAVQTAEAVGPKRLLPNFDGTPSKDVAAASITSGLKIEARKNSNIIFISYQNRDPELATLVLSQLVNHYFTKHLEVHRSAGAFDFVMQQTDQVRARLNQTEDALKELKARAEIVSLAESTTALSNDAVRTEEQLHAAEADLAEQEARVRHLGGPIVQLTGDDKSKDAAPAPSPASEEEIPGDALDQYQSVVSRLPQLREAKMDLLSRYTPQNQMVLAKQAEIDEAEAQRRSLERTYPSLPARVRPSPTSRNQSDPVVEAAHLAGLQAKKNALADRMKEIRKRMDKLSQLGPQIADLERQRQMEEDNYKYFQTALEKARIDEALDPSKIPNISVVQRPSRPMRVVNTRNKLMLMLAGSGLGAAVALVLIKELVLCHTLRRPVEFERFVGVSPLMSIPRHFGRNGSFASNANENDKAIVPKTDAGARLAPWDPGHFIRPFTDAIRDRLGLYFELHNLTHKPKLVGIAGFSENAGTSTLAAGLAAALSETNDGKVLLVDVSLGPDQVHPFFKGKPAYSLNTVLTANGPVNPAAENLYLAKVGSPQAGPAQLGLKKFFDLMPNLKASDFDYIIFDMPPLEQTSPTWGMAPFMDKMLLVVEAEQNNREEVKRSYKKLLVERDNISFILNKVRSYGPKQLELES